MPDTSFTFASTTTPAADLHRRKQACKWVETVRYAFVLGFEWGSTLVCGVLAGCGWGRSARGYVVPTVSPWGTATPQHLVVQLVLATTSCGLDCKGVEVPWLAGVAGRSMAQATRFSLLGGFVEPGYVGGVSGLDISVVVAPGPCLTSTLRAPGWAA